MINLSWVKDYIDIEDEDLKELAVKITEAGINVEKVITNNIDHLVVGEIVKCIPHPNSDHMHVCEVNVGSETTQIVCGAKNVREGLKVIVSLPGAKLPNGIEIKKSTLRGVESNGMICAAFEIGLESETEENYKKGIMELDSDAPVGMDAMKYLGLDDTLYELDIHKHRNNDCYYHIGFAYEIGTILNKKVHLPELTFKEDKESIKDKVSIKVDTEDCTYYTSRIATNITIKDSPDFIQKRLLSVGMRPINNVVDISNYVMLEFGQPLHFFDYQKLGNKIVVRNAKKNELITTLDNVERTLSKEDIVITNGKEPVCIAGIMGGLNTDVDDNTKEILIESAIFNPIKTRLSANRHNLKSEASIRMGKGLSHEYTDMALNRACNLLEKYADATILKDSIKVGNIDKTPKVVTFTKEGVNKILGIELTNDNIKTELERLDFPYTENKDEFTVTIPSRRLDIDPYVNDIAEEIGRLYGYQNLSSTLPLEYHKSGKYQGNLKLVKYISKRLRSLGLTETINYTLVSPNMAKLFDYEGKEKLVLPNPLSSDKSVIRTSLIPSLLNVYDYNKARKVKDIKIYEIAKTYDKNRNEETKIAMLLSGNYITNTWQGNKEIDFFLVKGIVENLLHSIGLQNRYSFVADKYDDLHPGISASIILDKEPVGLIGRVHPTIKKDDIYVVELSLDKLNKTIKPIKYKASSKYPSIEKDFAFIFKKGIVVKDILDTIKKKGGRLLDNTEVFDIYEGEKINNDEISIAFHLTFQEKERTLTDEEVMQVFNNIISSLEKEYNAVLRDK